MTFSPPRSLFLATVVVGTLALAGCDDSTDGTGGSSSSTGTNMGTTSSTGSTTSSASSTGSGVTQTAWEMYCDARAALNCKPTFDAAVCKTQQACATALLKDAIESDLIDCLSKNCNEDQCLSATTSVPLTSEAMNFVSGCQTWVTNCMGADDLCAGASYIEDDDLMKLGTCFSMGNCPMKQTCIDAFNTSVNACESWL